MARQRRKKTSEPATPRRHQLLTRALDIYRGALREHPAPEAFLAELHIPLDRLPEEQLPGYSAGNLDALLPRRGGIRSELVDLGLLTDDGHELLHGCLVLPLVGTRGDLVSLVGIHTDGENAIGLDDAPPGLWNLQAASSHDRLVAVANPLDALSLFGAGFDNTICPGTPARFSECADSVAAVPGTMARELVFLCGPDDTAHAPDSAEPIRSRAVLFDPVRTPSVVLREEGTAALAALVAERLASAETAADREDGAVNEANPQSGPVLISGAVRYTVPGLQKTSRKLRATVRVECSGRLHIDTLDLYNARMRRTLSQDICRVFELPAGRVVADIAKLITACEEHNSDSPDSASPADSPPSITAEERAGAESFGRSEDLFDCVLADYATCGLVGERPNKLLSYIAAVSRMMPEPLSVLILSSSGAGKTALQDATLRLCPPEDVVKLTTLSGKALFYKDGCSLQHKILAVEEGIGAEDASYAIRNLISAGELTTETTVRDMATGRLTTMENRVAGPTAVFVTTTDPDVDPETRSRFIVTSIDESPQQTRAILAHQRERYAKGAPDEAAVEAVLNRHHVFQRLLRPLKVTNPYASLLSYADDRLQGRRDQPKYLRLINAVAFVRQMAKPVTDRNGVESIAVDLTDIEVANGLVREILGRGLDELSRPARDLLALLDGLVRKRIDSLRAETAENTPCRTAVPFTRRDVREFSGWAHARVHRYIRELVDLEYVLAVNGRNGVRHRYFLAGGLSEGPAPRFVPNLRDPADIAAEFERLQRGELRV